MFPYTSDVPFLLNLLQFFDASSLASPACLLTLLDNPQVQATADVYAALYAACASFLSSTQVTAGVPVAQQNAFLLRSLSDDAEKNPTLVRARRTVLQSLCAARRVEFQKQWVELSRQQQCTLLCLMVGSEREEMDSLEVLDAVEECLLVDENRDDFWSLFCPFFFTHLFSFFRSSSFNLLNSKQATGAPPCLRQPFLLLLRLLSFFQYTDITISWNEWEIASVTCQSKEASVMCQFKEDSVTCQSKEASAARSVLCSAFATAFQTTMTSVVGEVCTGEPTDEMLLRFCLLVSVWSVLIAVREDVEAEECGQIQRALKRVLFHSELGARVWCMLLSLCETHTHCVQRCPALLESFAPFFEKCLRSSLLLGFDTPQPSEVFRYDLFLSVQHSDTLLLILLSSLPSFQSLLLSSSSLASLLTALPVLLCRMPYRSSLHLCAVQLLQDPSLSRDKAASLLQVLLAMPDRDGKALPVLFDHCAALHSLIAANIDAMWSSSLLQSNRPALQRAALVFVAQFYQTVPRKKQMVLLLFLERALICEAQQAIRTAAQATLETILHNTDNLDLVQSFTLSFIKKEWAKPKRNALALFALVEGLAPALPQFLPFLVAFALSGVKKPIPPAWVVNSLLSVASVCLYDMGCTRLAQSLKAICPDSSARKLLRASFIVQVLHQVLTTVRCDA